MPPKVVVQDLQKHYGAVHAADGVSFVIEDGEIFGLLGPNGAGKTTTVECVIGLREPDAGRIEICGLDARRQPNAVKQKIGAALQTTAVQDRLTPREALTLFGSFYRQSATPSELIDRFALADKADAPFETLSGGQRQRVALALAFVNRPELVFLDEPTAGLDPQARRELHAEIGRMKRDGHTVLLTTHQIDEAEALCDRVGIIDKGRIIATGSPHELITRSADVQSVSLTTDRALDQLALEAVPGIEALEIEGQRTRFRTATPAATLGRLLAVLDSERIGILDLHVRKATLEDVFIELTRS
jgi:ABC-2 type transport system ATP-binding protein